MKMCAAILSYLIHRTEPLNSSCQCEGDFSHMHHLVFLDQVPDHFLHLLQLLQSHIALRKQISHIQEKPPERYRMKEGDLGHSHQMI